MEVSGLKLEYLDAGEIVTTHGVRGELKVLPWADSPDFLCDFHRVIISGKEYAVAQCRVQKNCDLLKLSGIDTMEQAQLLRGKTVQVYRCDAPEGLIFAAELEGIAVYDGDALLGTLTEVLDYPGNKVYVVKGEREYMIPAVKQFIISTDLEENRMQVKLIEGMCTDEN